MAQRRMFSLDVIDTDRFLELPSTSQSLYFHLGMRADDDGFVSSPKRITSMINCSGDDLKLLLVKGFIISFESGVIVITDWNRNNQIRKDRHTPTKYSDEKRLLAVDESGTYRLDNQVSTISQPTDNQAVDTLATQYSKGKNRVEKDRLVIMGADASITTTKFAKPSLEEVIDYCRERNNNIDARKFVDYYTANGWKVGRNAMKDWKAAIRTWEQNKSKGYNDYGRNNENHSGEFSHLQYGKQL